jgi:hypothetical protein
MRASIILGTSVPRRWSVADVLERLNRSEHPGGGPPELVLKTLAGGYAIISIDDEAALKSELMTRGPIVLVGPITNDFLGNNEAAYDTSEDVSTKLCGYHAMSVLGWKACRTGETVLVVKNSWGALSNNVHIALSRLKEQRWALLVPLWKQEDGSDWTVARFRAQFDVHSRL